MKNIFFVLLALTTIGFYSCQKQPTASFSASKTTGTVGETISFTNSSTEGHSFEWNFGDGGTSTDENPSHTFATAGTFAVKLTAYSKNEKKSDESTMSITINELEPVANFTYYGAGGFAPCTVTFTSTSQNATSYSWDFGDGGTSSSTNPSHTYNSGGVFTVSLTATGAGGSNTISKTVNIESPPTKITITQLKLLDYPLVNGSGSNWDYSAGPDIYWVIMNEAMTTTYFIGGTVNDAVYSNLPFTYTNGLPYTITSLTTTYTILFFDADSPDADDFMDGYYFTPSDFSDYSNTLSFWSTISYLEFDLSVTWANSKNASIQTNGKKRIELKPIDRNQIVSK